MSLYEGPLFSVERRDGRDVVVHGPAVAIVAVDRDDHVTLVRQQRVPAGGKGLEQGEASPEGSEDIEIVRVPVAELESVIAGCDDAKTLAGLLLLTRHL